jgi:hypothetical protein
MYRICFKVHTPLEGEIKRVKRRSAANYTLFLTRSSRTAPQAGGALQRGKGDAIVGHSKRAGEPQPARPGE